MPFSHIDNYYIATRVCIFLGAVILSVLSISMCCVIIQYFSATCVTNVISIVL